MGECGCDLSVHRCRDHADDLVVALTRKQAEAIVVALEIRRLNGAWSSPRLRYAAAVAERDIARLLDASSREDRHG